MDLSFSTTDQDGIAVVRVGGEVDVYTAPQLRTALDEHISRGHTRLVIDLDGVQFLDSTGLGVLVGRLKLVRTRDGWVRIVCTNERILRVFTITGLDKVFPIHDSVEDATTTTS
ncbi:MAG TPA: STAS domain-containing protein [Dermatophilaceae bacterium]|nr:STAS domain-containing protein [Dermatophilaceae bacterium]